MNVEPIFEALDVPEPAARRVGCTIGGAASADMRYGQEVIVAARWVLILSGLVLILWEPGSLGQLRVQILTVLALAVTNFFLHAQLLVRKPTLDGVVYASSAADVVVITLLVLSQGGLASSLYTFYFPAILAISAAFNPATTTLYAGGAIGLYATLGVLTAQSDNDLQQLIVRVVMLAAVAVCGSVYWRLEHRRREPADARREQAAELAA